MKIEPETLYVINQETGEVFELGSIDSIDYRTLQEDYGTLQEIDSKKMPGSISFEFKMKIQPKTKLVLLGITNNCIRMHGGKPIRRVQKRFL